MCHCAKFVAIGKSLLSYGDLTAFNMASVHRLRFLKIQFLTSSTVMANVHNFAKYCAVLLNCYRYIAIFLLFKMAAVRHLVFYIFKILTADSGLQLQKKPYE